MMSMIQRTAVMVMSEGSGRLVVVTNVRWQQHTSSAVMDVDVDVDDAMTCI